MNKPTTQTIFETLRKGYQDTNQTEIRFYLDAKEKVYYRLLKYRDGHYSDEHYHLQFWIETYALGRDSLQECLKNEFLCDTAQREYKLCSYHSSLGVSCLRPTMTAQDLEADLKSLRNRLKSIEERIRKTDSSSAEDSPVGIGETNLLTLLGYPLNIPDYQRAYCWGKENILGLLEDLSRWQRSHEKADYRVGTIILKKQSAYYDVIDGQQRLITLALLASLCGEAKCDAITLGTSNQTHQALQTIRNAKKTVQDWVSAHKSGSIDLQHTTMSVVIIGEKESEDLSFRFFNHLNSSGVPLTDYDLLKGHHLRYVKEDKIAEIMARRWDSLDNATTDKCNINGRNSKEILLHLFLFRIRKWLRNDPFDEKADSLDSHDLFKEFSLGFEPVHGLCTSFKPIEIDSLLSGGIEFFTYIDCFRQLVESFAKQESVEKLRPLRWHSNGTLHEGILALLFMFYCKFGEVYLNEAAYAIAWTVSQLRNEYSVKKAFVGNPVKGKQVFREVAIAISRATHEGEVFGCLLDPMKIYAISQRGKTADNYWLTLRDVAEKLQDPRSKLAEIGRTFIESLTDNVWKEHQNN